MKISAVDSKSQTALAHKTHSFSGAYLWQYPRFVESLLDVKIAAILANSDSGQMELKVANELLEKCKLLKNSSKDPSFFVADVYQGGGGIALNTNINDLLSDKTPNPANLSQSTADVCATAGRICLWRLGQDFLFELRNLSEEIGKKSKEFVGRKFMARTCLQDAMPAGFSEYFTAWEAALVRSHAAIGGALDQLLMVNLGGTVIGSGEGASHEYRATVLSKLRETTGLRLTERDNFFDAAQFADDLLRVANELESLSLILHKQAQDLRLLASGPIAGFGELSLPKVIHGSSFFAAKNNPTIPETLIQACILVRGRVFSARLAHAESELNLNVFEPIVHFLLYEAMEFLRESLTKYTKNCMRGLAIGPKGN